MRLRSECRDELPQDMGQTQYVLASLSAPGHRPAAAETSSPSCSGRRPFRPARGLRYRTAGWSGWQLC